MKDEEKPPYQRPEDYFVFLHATKYACTKKQLGLKINSSKG
jgi:hypothetical protein